MEPLLPTDNALSVIILTKDEEAFIERAMGSVAFADEVIVVDSGSTDATCQLAEDAGARVVHQEWLGWSGQRNRGAAAAAHDWVLFLEADEIVSEELARSLRGVLRGPMDPRDGYALNRRHDFLGALLPNEARRSKRRSFVRLYNREASGWDTEQLVHEEVRYPGRGIPVEGVLLHWRGLTLEEIGGVFVRYAGIEADQLERRGVRARPYDLVGRPIARFVWTYLLRGSFRLGVRGLAYAVIKSFSEFLRWGTLWERQKLPRRVVDPPKAIYGASPERRPLKRSVP